MNSSINYDFYSDTYKFISVGYFTLTTLAGVMLCLFGHFHAVYNAIDYIAMIYFLFCTNAVFPINVLDFAKCFGTFLYDFVPNPITDNSDSALTSASTSTNLSYAFTRHGYSNYFLSNASYTFLLIGAILVIYLLLKPFSYCDYFARLRLFLQHGWECNALIHLLVICSNQISVFICLQSLSLTLEDRSSSIVNFATCIFCALVIILSPILLYFWIDSRKQDFHKPAHLRTSRIIYLSVLRNLKINQEPLDADMNTVPIQTTHIQIETHIDNNQTNDLTREAQRTYSKDELQLFSSLCKYTNLFTMIRRALFACLLVFLVDYKIFSMIGMIVLNVCLLIHYIWIQPHVFRFDNYRNAFKELVFIALEALLIYFDSDPTSKSVAATSGSTYYIGWVYIILCCAVLLAVFVDLVHKIFRAIEDLTDEAVKKDTKQQKVLPIPEESIVGPQQTHQSQNQIDISNQREQEQKELIDDSESPFPQNHTQTQKTYIKSSDMRAAGVIIPTDEAVPSTQPVFYGPENRPIGYNSQIKDNNIHDNKSTNGQSNSYINDNKPQYGPENRPYGYSSQVQAGQENTDPYAQDNRQQSQPYGNSNRGMNNPDSGIRSPTAAYSATRSPQNQNQINAIDERSPFAPRKNYNNNTNPTNNRNMYGNGNTIPEENEASIDANTMYGDRENSYQDNSLNSYEMTSALPLGYISKGRNNINSSNTKDEINAQKMRMKDAAFKRNPFISHNDKDLLQQVKNSNRKYM